MTEITSTTVIRGRLRSGRKGLPKEKLRDAKARQRIIIGVSLKKIWGSDEE